jgi:hypothetical protein
MSGIRNRPPKKRCIDNFFMRNLKIFLILLITIGYFVILPDSSYSREIVLYCFEKDPQGWEIPDWAITKTDHVARQLSVSEFHSTEGKYSLEVNVDFSGGPKWEGAYVERIIDVTDWSPFNYLSYDGYLPKNGPQGLRVRTIVTVGDEWKWTEGNKAFPLTPGEWTSVKLDLTPNSMVWRKFVDDSFRADIRKLGIRLESNGKITYKGPIYIDNVKLSSD